MRTEPSNIQAGRCWAVALGKGEIWQRALKLGLPVGFLQVAVNQGDFWLHHQAGGVVMVKSVLSPMIAIGIALLSSAATDVKRQKEKSQ